VTADVEPHAAPGVLDEPAPLVDESWSSNRLEELFGVRAALTPLRSERDRNWLARTDDGRELVLKVSNSAEDHAVVAMENAAMRHVAAVDPGLAIPRLVTARDGADLAWATAPDDRQHLLRVVTVLPGEAADLHVPPPSFAGELGRWSARLAVALQGFFHPAGGRAIEWDPRRAPDLRPHVGRLAKDRRDQVAEVLDRVVGIGARTRGLPSSVLHADVTMSNVLVDDTGITGIVDFGDMHHTARVCDAAISLASLLRVVTMRREDPWRATAEFLEGYQRVAPLEPEEVDVLGDLLLARLAATVLISAWRVPENPDNVDYLSGLDEGSWLMLDVLTALDPDVLAERVRRLCGTDRLGAGTLPDPSLLARRHAAMGGALAPLFYREPLHVVRGDGPWLETADGRRYLDAYNNVPVVGHEHPVVVQAVTRQARLLNTNSRYLHAHVVELAERLVASMPPGLDTCVFVNSGSEATDRAWRLATTWTGRSGGIVTDCSYHGVSAATAALSSNTWPEGHRPDHVAAFGPPYALLSGEEVGADEAHRRIGEAVADLRSRGHEPALVAVDPMFTSAGVLEPDPSFVQGLVDAAHECGALFLADEVQAGFGRGGHHLWRFADFGVVPDVVTLGKPMGNGHPVAAVLTRREVVDRLAARDEFFSTFGGNPVSCAAGLAVLDVIEQQGLLVHAAETGDVLRAAVRELAAQRPAIGAVRGRGLIAGIDLRTPSGPSRSCTDDVVNRLRDLGVLVGSTGADGTVLKVRPPLVWERRHVDLFVQALDAALDP
jgi:4-aminobutyrate aminotransferase-like enzyme/Ser/Thr protein kinase RdoA (MazF antagonist)